MKLYEILNDITESTITVGGLDINSEEFHDWFAGSKFMKDGLPMILYHQTTDVAATNIRQNHFNLGIIGSRSNDFEVPDGVFLKPSRDKIGIVKGDNQIPVVISVKNPLIVKNRAYLVEFLMRNDEYKKYAKMCKDVENRSLKWLSAKGDWDTADTRYGSKHADKYLDTSSKVVANHAVHARKVATQFLKSQGYDGVELEYDEGAMGKITKTIIVFDPQQIKIVKYKW